MTASGHTLSRVALVTASGHAGDYLPLLPARLEAPGRLARREMQEGAEAVVSQPPAVSEVSVAVPPAAGGAVFIVTSVCCAGSCQVLFCACQDPLPWERFAVLRVWLRRLLGLGSVVPFDFCSWCSRNWCCDCDACWSW